MAAASPKPNLLQDGIPKTLMSLGVPMTMSLMLMMFAGIVDTYFLGKLGARELAVMSFAYPVITLVMSIAFGLNIGSTAAISRAVGGGDRSVVRRLATHAMALALLVVAILSTIGIVFEGPIFRALGAKEDILPHVSSYMTIWFGGVVFLVVPMVGNGAMNATGDSKTPAKIMAAFAATNLVLDPIFIFGAGPIPALGLRGAAIASVLARIVTTVVSFWILGVRMRILDLHIPSMQELWGSWKRILSVGLPAAITNALMPISTAILISFIAHHGSDTVAAYGLGSRLDGLLLIPSMALSMALTPFIGQNWGAHRIDRVADALRLTERVVIVWGAAMWVLMLFVRERVARVFTADPDVIALASEYLFYIPLAYGATGVVSVVSSTFNAIDRAVRSTIISALRGLGLALPLAWLGGQFWGARGLFIGVASATGIAAVVAILWTRSALQPKEKPAIGKPAEGIVGIDRAREAAFDALLDAIVEIEGIIASARPINTIGFYFKGRELGHVHRKGHVDLHVPMLVHDQLIREARAAHHRSQHGTSWISHDLFAASDVGEAAWLLKLTMIIAQIGQKGGIPDASDKQAIESLSPSPELLSAVLRSFQDGEHDVERAAIAA
jgi:putative MATE family efflux protein